LGVKGLTTLLLFATSTPVSCVYSPFSVLGTLTFCNGVADDGGGGDGGGGGGGDGGVIRSDPILIPLIHFDIMSTCHGWADESIDVIDIFNIDGTDISKKHQITYLVWQVLP
jgi:hypothetical protein